MPKMLSLGVTYSVVEEHVNMRLFPVFKYFSISNKQTISYINQSPESSVGFGNLRRCGTLVYHSAVRCGAVQGFSNGPRHGSCTGYLNTGKTQKDAERRKKTRKGAKRRGKTQKDGKKTQKSSKKAPKMYYIMISL